jgi:hypothetical protein
VVIVGSQSTAGASDGVIIGELVFWSVATAIPAIIAWRKGHSFAGWWLVSSILWFVTLPGALLIKPDFPELERRQIALGMRKCPHCAEFVKGEAVVCRYCGRDLPKITVADVASWPHTMKASQFVKGIVVEE